MSDSDSYHAKMVYLSIYVNNVLYVYNCIHKKAIKPSYLVSCLFYSIHMKLYHDLSISHVSHYSHVLNKVSCYTVLVESCCDALHW